MLEEPLDSERGIMSEVILFGEAMVMFTAASPGPLDEVSNFTRLLAGAEVNVAIGLRRLGHTVSYVTKLGKDPFGRYIRRKLEEEQLEACILEESDYWTGFQLKNKVLSGDPEVYYFRKNSAASHITSGDIEKVDLNGARMLHLTGIPAALSKDCREASFRLLERAKEAGLTVSFDPNIRPSLWEDPYTMKETINALAAQADIVLPGIGEGEILMGSRNPEDIAAYYRHLGAKMVFVKAGPEKTFVSSEEETGYYPGFKVDHVVDTVGAGDGFAVGILSACLEKKTVSEMVERGNAIGAMQVMVESDNEGLPGPKELACFIAANRSASSGRSI